MPKNNSFSQARVDDPLTLGPMSSQRPFPERLFYATGVMLDKEDFLAEQLYHRGRLARALAYLHGQGTVAGLRGRIDPPVRATRDQPAKEEELVVEPGLAIDRFGRLIEVPRPCCIRLDRWFKGQANSDLSSAFKAPSVKTLISQNFDFQVSTSTTVEGPIEVGGGLNGLVVDVFVRFVSCQQGYTSAFASGPFEATDATAPARLRDGFEFS